MVRDIPAGLSLKLTSRCRRCFRPLRRRKTPLVIPKGRCRILDGETEREVVAWRGKRNGEVDPYVFGVWATVWTEGRAHGKTQLVCQPCFRIMEALLHDDGSILEDHADLSEEGE